jgi:hypothetical protein
VEAWGGVPQGVRDPPGCNVPEFRPCESVLHPCSHRRQLRELYGQARKALKANAKREHNALEWAIGAVEKSTERNVRRSRVNRVADSLDFLSQGSLDFRPDFPERDLGRAAIRKMEIGVSAGRRPPAGRSAAECTGSARPSRARIVDQTDERERIADAPLVRCCTPVEPRASPLAKALERDVEHRDHE